jgi:hypothetical protein
MVEWQVVPRSFHLSYVANRARSSLGLLGEASLRLSKFIDVKVPVGWLGDVVLVLARPVQPSIHSVATVDELRGHLSNRRGASQGSSGLEPELSLEGPRKLVDE